MRPLYLDGGTPMLVALDGPALRVSSPRRADGRYPLRRLSRVVVSGQVDWRTNALLACLDRGITVTFLDAEGSPRGHCMGATARDVELADALEALLDRPDWRAIYDNWLAASQRRAMNGLLGRSAEPLDLRPARVREALLARQLRYAAPAAVRRVDAHLRGLLGALSPELLDRAGLRPLLPALRDRGLNLVSDLTSILGWGLYPLGEELVRAHGGEPSRAATLAAFEAEVGAFRRRGRGILKSLERRLREVA